MQEEIGLRGAEMITHTIKPNVAIVTDVTHDSTTPMIDKKIEGDLVDASKEKGPQYYTGASKRKLASSRNLNGEGSIEELQREFRQKISQEKVFAMDFATKP